MLLAKNLYRRPIHELPCVQGVFKLRKQQRYVSDSSVKDKSLYRILGVSPNATQIEIKDSYYNLTLKFHPDRNEGSPEAAVKFHEITEAYEVLGNYFMRKRYDKGLPLPTRHEAAAPDITAPHVVKYQRFFDSRNLPFQPSAYAAGAGASKFDEYHAKQFYERRKRAEVDEDREYLEECKSKKVPTMVAFILMVALINYLKKDLDMYVGPLIEVEHFDQFSE